MKSLLILLILMLRGIQEGSPSPANQGNPPKEQPKNQPPSKIWRPLTEEEEAQMRKAQEHFQATPVAEPTMPAIEEAKSKGGGIVMMPGNLGYLWKSQDPKGVHRVVLPARVIHNSGLIEVFATVSEARDHEAVIRVDCDIHATDISINHGLRLARGNLPEKYGVETKSRVVALLQWKDDEGRTVTYRVEDLILDFRRNRKFPRVGWLYRGGWLVTQDPLTGKERRALLAAYSKMLITTWRDPQSLIDNVLKDEDAGPDSYFANLFVLPKEGTPALLILRRPTPEEAAEILKVEKELYPE